jgi:phosphoesterase RecJ-like protein
LINLTLTIQGTQFALIFVEQQAGGVKVSFRSRCALNCNEIAARFSGGGHKAAAGAFQDRPFDDVRNDVLAYVRAQMAH